MIRPWFLATFWIINNQIFKVLYLECTSGLLSVSVLL
jgi:hypothetical protein